MNVGIVGARKRNGYEDWDKVYDEFEKIKNKHNIGFIVSGGQKLGADGWAETISVEEELDMKIYRARWKQYGNSAGPIRNSMIAKDSDILIACPHPEGTGTQDTMRKFKEHHPDGQMVVL